MCYYVIKKWDSSDITQNQIGRSKVNYAEDAGMNRKQRIAKMKFFEKIPCDKCDLKFKNQEEVNATSTNYTLQRFTIRL